MIPKVTVILIVFVIILAAGNDTSAQFTINLPKIVKPKSDQTKTGVDPNGRDAADHTQSRPKTADGKFVYPPQRPNSTPVLLKNSIHIQTVKHNEYWKMPNQSNYSSWVPRLRFDLFYNNDKKLNYTVEYFNPDGSLWFSDKLEQSNSLDAERCVLFQTPSPWGGVLNTKSTAATGVFSFKITNDDTKEVLYQGRFKVGKFSISHDPQREKNKVEFFVDHDWLIPFAQIGFHHAISEIGGMPLLASFWLKGPIEKDELEGRVFYKGQQIASTNENGGVNSREERYSDSAPAFAPQNVWKQWEMQWNDFLVDNNGTFNRDNYPKAFYADKNPGDYTVRLYRNGAQIREMNFTVGADGRIVTPAYTSQIFIPYYRTLFPAKVGGTEKWGVNDWKTDAFYGNPLSGFAVQ
jgi:hypothetical protein